MTRGEALGIAVACGLRDRGHDHDVYWMACERIMRSDDPDGQALEELNTTCLDLNDALEIFADFERVIARHPPSGVSVIGLANRVGSGTPTRTVRTKRYGPAQDPVTWDSAEKQRAYAYALAFIPAEHHERLREADWLPLVGTVLRRDGHICTYCGAAGDEYVLHCDHIVPISKGGTNDLENLTTACEFCNCSKRDALPHEWRPLPGGGR